MMPLHARDYGLVLPYLETIPMNTLFAQSVANGMMPGRIHVDDDAAPGVFHIVHPYGMSLLCGEPSEAFADAFCAYMANRGHARNGFEWLQVYPTAWSGILEPRLGALLVNGARPDIPDDRVVRHTRVNFRFDQDAYREAGQPSMAPKAPGITRIAGDAFDDMQGSVVPRFFWRDADDFAANGIGYCVVVDGRMASVAFSSFIIGNRLEIGIETLPEYRGKGLATRVCSALIDHCLGNGYEPVWSCRLENTGSYRLAQRLGFVPTLRLPYYRLAL